MARPRRITDEAIKAAAREVFVEHGPGAPVSLVAKKLGVSHAALFGRAGSKAKLMMESLRPQRPQVMECLVEAPPQEGVQARLVELLEALLVFFRQVVPNLVVLKAAGYAMDLPSGGGPPPPVALREALRRWLTAAVEAGSLEPLHAWSVAEGLLGALEARCFNGYLGNETYTPGDDATFVRELVRGLLPGEEQR